MRSRRPVYFSEGAWVDVVYHSPKDTRGETKTVSGRIVSDDETEFVIEEQKRNLKKTRENEHRRVRVDTETLEAFSDTENRTTLLGAVGKVRLIEPPWESSADKSATGWWWIATWNNRIVREGCYEFPDPDHMEQPEGWSP